VAGAVFFASSGRPMAGDGPGLSIASARTGAIKEDSAVLPKISQARAFLRAGQVRECEECLKPIVASDPEAAEAHALMGEACSRLMDYQTALREYRVALSLDPDYVDWRSEKFIGKRIKAAVREAKPQFLATLQKNGEDQAARAAMADVNYLDRMLAGGCE